MKPPDGWLLQDTRREKAGPHGREEASKREKDEKNEKKGEEVTVDVLRKHLIENENIEEYVSSLLEYDPLLDR